MTSPRLLASLLLTSLLLVAFTPPPDGPIHGRPKTQTRPALSGPGLTHPTEHFVIHYTLDGEDAVTANDENGDGLPDFVEAVAEAMEHSWQHEVETLHWLPPLPDEGEGGDARLDVYLEDQNDTFGAGDLFGYTDTFGGFVGDNPTTPTREKRTAYGFVSLDNDYDPDQFGLYDLDPLDAMRTTAAHEFNHTLQSAYDDEDVHSWLYEATATWMEDEVYPEIGDARSYLADYMDAPDLCPLSVGRDDQDVRWYGGWILLRYLSEQHGGPDTIRRLWENMAQKEGLIALINTVTGQKTTLAKLLTNFSVANLTKSECPANAPYCYQDGSNYLRPYVEGSVHLDPDEITTFSPKDGVQQFAADYIRLKSDGPLRLRFQGSPTGEWQLRLVGLTGEKAKVIAWTAASPTTIDPSPYEKLYLVVVNTAPVETEEDCRYFNYTLSLAAGAATGLPSAPTLPKDPGPYIPPVYQGGGSVIVEPPHAPSGGQPIAPEAAAFPPLYPGYLPAGYTFAEVVSYTLADLGNWEQAYAPGGEPIVGLRYTGAGPDDYLSLIQSSAPRQTLAAWVKAMDYWENDVRLINDHSVHLVEYKHENDLFSVATFLQHDRFIVIHGSVGLIEMQHIVAGFLVNNP